MLGPQLPGPLSERVSCAVEVVVQFLFAEFGGQTAAVALGVLELAKLRVFEGLEREG